MARKRRLLGCELVRVSEALQKKKMLEKAATKEMIRPKSNIDKKPLIRFPFEKDHHILLLGEGNFSFAASLANILEDGQNLVCTTIDDEQTLLLKYPDARQNLDILSAKKALVFFSVDATLLSEDGRFHGQLFDRVVFNFLHVGLGIKDQSQNIAANQELIMGVFAAVWRSINPKRGQLLITLKSGEPYDLWSLPRIAQSTGILRLRNCVAFRADQYPGYVHRRTVGFDEIKCPVENEDISKSRCKTYIFERIPKEERKKAK